jgi:hypothetical protein
MNLIYKKKSGHIKLNDAVIGMVSTNGRTWAYVHYSWKQRTPLPDMEQLAELLAAIRAWLTKGLPVENF